MKGEMMENDNKTTGDQTTGTDYVLAELDTLTVWNFYSSLDAAASDQVRVNEKEGGDGKQRHYKPMSYSDYAAHERKTYLSRPLTETTKSQYWYALEVLPPKNFEQCAGFESFLMIEHWSGPYTDQYVEYRGRYFSKLVDSLDRSTWMTPATLAKHCAQTIDAKPAVQREKPLQPVNKESNR